MPKKGEAWSPERRAAFEAARNEKLLAGPRPAVAVMDRPLPGEDDFEEPEILTPTGTSMREQVSDNAVLSRTELFRSRARNGAPITTVDDLGQFAGEDTEILDDQKESNVEHSSAGRVVMFTKEVWGWRRVVVSRNSVDELLRAGFIDRCGDCGSQKCAGLPGNYCPKRAPVAYRTCPISGCNGGNPKKFFDIGVVAVQPETDDPFAIIDEAYAQSTPASRTKAQLDAHLRAYHETTAMEMGLFNIQERR